MFSDEKKYRETVAACTLAQYRSDQWNPAVTYAVPAGQITSSIKRFAIGNVV